MLKLNERILRKRKTYMNNFSESVLALKKRNIVNTIKELAHEINLSCLVTQHMMQWVDIFSTNYLIFDWFFCVFFTCRNWEDRKFTDDQRNPVQKGISRCLKLVKFLKYVIQLKKCFLKLLRFIFCKNWYNPIFFFREEADDSIDKFTEIQKGPGSLSSIPGLFTKSADDSHATTSDSSSKESKIPKITSPLKKRTQVNHGTTPESHLRNLCEQVSKFVYFITKLIL